MWLYTTSWSNSSSIYTPFLSTQVLFRNEVSGEFQFYYVTFKSTAPGVIGTIEMATPVRLSTSHLITVENPLSFPVTFATNCSVVDIMLPPQLVVPPTSEVCILCMEIFCQVFTVLGTLLMEQQFRLCSTIDLCP